MAARPCCCSRGLHIPSSAEMDDTRPVRALQAIRGGNFHRDPAVHERSGVGLRLLKRAKALHICQHACASPGTGIYFVSCCESATAVRAVGSMLIDAIPFDTADNSSIVASEGGRFSHEDSYRQHKSKRK